MPRRTHRMTDSQIATARTRRTVRAERDRRAAGDEQPRARLHVTS